MSSTLGNGCAEQTAFELSHKRV